MTDMKNQESVTAAVVLLLAVLLIAWGWMRAHAQVELNPTSAPPANAKGGGGFVSTE